VAALGQQGRIHHIGIGADHQVTASSARTANLRRALRTRDNRKRPDNPSRTPPWGARWIGSAILLVSLMLGPAVALAQPTERAPDTMEARLLACGACHGRQGEGTKNDYFPRLAGKPAGFEFSPPPQQGAKPEAQTDNAAAAVPIGH
jgi:cytochrome c553